mgnify:CR=1 FL=1
MSNRGRPKVKVRMEDVAILKDQGLSFRQIAKELGIGASTAHALFGQVRNNPQNGPKEALKKS